MTYGYRRITEGIRIKYGVIFNNKKVQRIMKSLNVSEILLFVPLSFIDLYQ